MYSPKHLDAQSLESLRASVQNELGRVAITMSQPIEYLALKTLYEAPKRIFDGMVILADGTTWNPGSGAGLYARVAGAWVKL